MASNGVHTTPARPTRPPAPPASAPPGASAQANGSGSRKAKTKNKSANSRRDREASSATDPINEPQTPPHPAHDRQAAPPGNAGISPATTKHSKPRNRKADQRQVSESSTSSQPSAPAPAPSHVSNASQTAASIASAVTPAKAQAYAGPTFHASPAPSSLPLPRFFSKSAPVADKVIAQPPSVTSSSSPSPAPSPSRPPPLQPANNTAGGPSPLDLLFKADRRDKARVTVTPELAPASKVRAASVSPAPSAASKTMPRPPATTSSMFPMELDATDSRQAGTAPAQPYPLAADRPGNSSGVAAHDHARAKTQALKQLLMHTPHHVHSPPPLQAAHLGSASQDALDYRPNGNTIDNRIRSLPQNGTHANTIAAGISRSSYNQNQTLFRSTPSNHPSNFPGIGLPSRTISSDQTTFMSQKSPLARPSSSDQASSAPFQGRVGSADPAAAFAYQGPSTRSGSAHHQQQMSSDYPLNSQGSNLPHQGSVSRPLSSQLKQEILADLSATPWHNPNSPTPMHILKRMPPNDHPSSDRVASLPGVMPSSNSAAASLPYGGSLAMPREQLRSPVNVANQAQHPYPSATNPSRPAPDYGGGQSTQNHGPMPSADHGLQAHLENTTAVPSTATIENELRKMLKLNGSASSSARS